MFQNIRKIKIEGQMLSEPTIFPLFDKENQLILLMYGKNGSGKSTIARAMENCSQKKSYEDISAQFLESDNKPVCLTDEQKASLFVFNEEYVEQTVKLKTKGLDTIVLLGEQVDLNEKIDTAKKELDEANKSKEDQKEICSEYSDSNNLRSPINQWNLLCDNLKGADSWAEKDAQIKELRQNSKVTEAIALEIAEMKVTKPADQLNIDFCKARQILSGITPDSEKIRSDLEEIVLISKEDLIISLLGKKIEEPILSERDKFLMSLVREHGQQYYLDVKAFFENSNHKQCPYCLQPIETEYKEDLIKRIQGIMSDTVKEHLGQLEELKLPEISFSEEQYNKIDQEQVRKTRNAINKVEGIANYCREKIENKKKHVYTPISFPPIDGKITLGLTTAIKEANTEIQALLQLITEYNKTISDFQNTKDIALRLNKEIAALKIASSYKTYKKQLQEKKDQENKLELLVKNETTKREIYNDLLQKKKSTLIACDKINSDLQYIFFNKTRLTIEPYGDNYVIKSNGKSVLPSSISIGERNALALCYFMTNINNGQNEDEIYKQALFLVIDDPITSFDKENRIGVLSFLKSQFLHMFRGNKQSRLILLSHDFCTIFDLQKGCTEIVNSLNKNFGKKDHYQLKLSELSHWNILQLSYKGNEYSRLLKMVFEYGNDKHDEYDPFIGNLIRRVFEAFATFEYRKGISEISCDPTILKSLKNMKYEKYFENLMCRLVLDSESHTSDGVKSLNNLIFFDAISMDDKKRTARDVLCFMHLLNSEHVSAHFEGENTALARIEIWEQIILGNPGESTSMAESS